MAQDNIKNRVLGSFGVNPDNPPTLSNTVSNLKQKGLLGSVAQGAIDTANAAAIQSTNFGKQFIEVGKSVGSTIGKVLFGAGDQRTQGGQSEGGGASINNAGNTGVMNNANVQTSPKFGTINPVESATQVSPVSVTPQLGSTVNPNLIRTVTQSGSTLNVDNKMGGTGSISFQDGRTLSPDKLGRLEKDINYNALQSTKDKFAQEAAIVAQRRQDATEFMRFRSLPPQARALAQANFDSDRGKIAAQAAQAEATSKIGQQRLATDIIKQQETQDFNRQKLGQENQVNLAKLLTSPEGQALELKDKLAASRKITGKVDINTFKMSHDPSFVSKSLQSEDSLRQSLLDQGYPQEDALNILDSWRQSEGIQ